MERNVVSLIHINTLFDSGLPNTSSPTRYLYNWAKIHVQKHAGIGEQKLISQYKSGTHILTEILLKYRPEFITLNEVLPNAGESLEILNHRGYNVIVGTPTVTSRRIYATTIIAGRRNLQEKPFELPFDHVGAVRAYVPQLDLTIISIHIPPEKERTKQKKLRILADEISKKHAYTRLILTGDFNTESIKILTEKLGLNHINIPTFPSDRLYTILKKPLGRLIKQKALDHIMVTNNITFTIEGVETRSDHKGLYLKGIMK